MKNLTDWLNANKISLNVQKTKFVIFKHQRKKINSEVKIELSRKRLYLADFVEHLLIGIDELEFCQCQHSEAIYYAMFDSHIRYAWYSHIKRLWELLVFSHNYSAGASFTSKLSKPLFRANM